ncbi:MAG: hypothetical protein AAF466_13305 [Bacteroidota bacterium]
MSSRIILILLLIPFAAWSQGDTNTQLQNLAPPSSPAFVLMDISPSSVYTPESLKALSLQLLNGLGSGSSDGIPKNIAVEFVPFWYTTPKNMNFLKYYNLKKSDPNVEGATGYDSQNVFGDIFKRASVSFEFMENTFEVFDSPQNFISAGARTTLVKVLRKQDIQNIISKYNNYDAFLKKFILDPNNSIEDLATSEEYLKARDDLNDAVNMKPLLTVDLALAYSALLNNSNANFSDTLGRYGAWISADLALGFANNSNNYIHVHSVARYIKDGLNLDAENRLFNTESYDIGGKLEIELNKLSIGYEFITREGDVDEYRSIGTIRYEVSKSITLTGGFGKNFKSEDNTISLLGVKWGINTGEGALAIPGLQ